MSQLSLDFSTSEYEIPTPKTPRRNCTRDERLRAQTLYLHAGWSKDDIALQLNLTWNCSVYAIETAFKHEGFARRTALKKPVLTEAHKKARLTWAEEHINWTWEQWKWIFWTDETWVNPGKHKKTKITRRIGEVLHPDCLEPKIRKKIGWMFW